MSAFITYVKGGELPDLLVTWLDGAGTPVDLTDYDLEVKLAKRTDLPAALTKTDGLTGGPTGLVVSWDGELDDLPAGYYVMQFTASRDDGKPRRQLRYLHLEDGIT